MSAADVHILSLVRCEEIKDIGVSESHFWLRSNTGEPPTLTVFAPLERQQNNL